MNAPVGDGNNFFALSYRVSLLIRDMNAPVGDGNIILLFMLPVAEHN